MSITKKGKAAVRRTLVAAVKPFPPLRRAVRNGLASHRNRIYRHIKLNTPTEPQTIIFESFNGRSYSDNPRAIYEYMLGDKRFANYHFIWAFKSDKLANIIDNFPQLNRAEIVQAGSSDYYHAYARAGIWISNSRLHAYLQPMRGQKYIQTWHGTALKKLGHDIQHEGGNAMYTKRDIQYKNDSDVKRYHALVSPSPFMTNVFKSAFNLDEVNKKCHVWETGYPRNDRLANAKNEDIVELKRQLGIPADKKVILYAPTWRDNQHKAGTGYTYQNELDFDKMRQAFSDTHVILFRAHYFIANQFDFAKYDGFVYDVSKVDDVNDLYLVSDMLVTDYSSVFFDYAILNRPIYFYMYDLTDYRDKLHGFYLPLTDLPGPITETTSELIKAIKKPWKLTKKYQQFVKTYAPLDDGRASKRVAEEVLDITVASKLGRPVISSLTKPKLKIKNSNATITSLCIVKIPGESSLDFTKFNCLINETSHSIKFRTSRPKIKLPRGYRLNRLTITIPLSDLLNADIQNKLLIVYADDINHASTLKFKTSDGNQDRLRHSRLRFYDNTAMYLRQSVGNTTYLTIRPRNNLDTKLATVKIAVAKVLASISLGNDKLILLYEKDCNRYQESASVVYEALRQRGYDRAYYIIDKNSADVAAIPEKFRDNIIYKHTFRHLYYFFRCNTFIGTETIGHAIQLRTANRSIIKKEQSNKLKYIFLQHGVMYMVSLNSPLRSGFRNQHHYQKYKVVVSSRAEKQHFIDLANFNESDLYVTGLPKFDRAISNKDADKIVIMPTWRRWEANQASRDYESTAYCQLIKRIARAVPRELEDKIIILPHPLMANALKQNPNYGKYMPGNDVPYDTILRDCRVLITDYSSISYDAFYRGANVIFDWSEKDDCMQMYGEGVYLLLNEDNVFGDIHYKEDKSMTESIREAYNKPQPAKYVKNYRQIVEFNDNHNTDRLIKLLSEEDII